MLRPSLRSVVRSLFKSEVADDDDRAGQHWEWLLLVSMLDEEEEEEVAALPILFLISQFLITPYFYRPQAVPS